MEAIDFVISMWFLAAILIITIIVVAIKNKVLNNSKYTMLKICRDIYGDTLGNYKYYEFKGIFKDMKPEDKRKIHLGADSILVIINSSQKIPNVSTIDVLADVFIKNRMYMEVMKLRKCLEAANNNHKLLDEAITLVELFFLLSSKDKDSISLARLKHIRTLWKDKKKS